MTPAKDSVAEAVRISHCANTAEPQHACVGECNITAAGVYLNCVRCGNSGSELTVYQHPGYHKLANILGVLNIDISLIRPYAIQEMIKLLVTV